MHGRTRDDIAAMAAGWEPVPPLFQQLDASGLLSGRVQDGKGASVGGGPAESATNAAQGPAGGDNHQDSAADAPPVPADEPHPAANGINGGRADAAGMGRDDEEDAVSPPAAKAGSRCLPLLLGPALICHCLSSQLSLPPAQGFVKHVAALVPLLHHHLVMILA